MTLESSLEARFFAPCVTFERLHICIHTDVWGAAEKPSLEKTRFLRCFVIWSQSSLKRCLSSKYCYAVVREKYDCISWNGSKMMTQKFLISAVSLTVFYNYAHFFCTIVWNVVHWATAILCSSWALRLLAGCPIELKEFVYSFHELITQPQPQIKRKTSRTGPINREGNNTARGNVPWWDSKQTSKWRLQNRPLSLRL